MDVPPTLKELFTFKDLEVKRQKNEISEAQKKENGEFEELNSSITSAKKRRKVMRRVTKSIAYKRKLTKEKDTDPTMAKT